MRRFIRTHTVKRHAIYTVIDDGEIGRFFVCVIEPTPGMRAKVIAEYPYAPGNAEEEARAKHKALSAMYSMAQTGKQWLESGRTDEPRTFSEAKEDAEALERMKSQQPNEAELSEEEARAIDAKAEEAAPLVREQELGRGSR